MPEISILMPVRNEQDLLPATLQSLARQTFTDWELVAVNDGSEDRTAAILDEWAAKDHRYRILHRPQEGLVAALNAGLEQCRGALVARMDADDICHPRRLALQKNYIAQHPEVDLVACRVRHIPRSSVRNGFLAYEAWQNSLLDHEAIVRDMFVESPFAHPSVMFRQHAVIIAGGYRDMGWAEDYDLWLRLMYNGARFARLPETLLYWRDRPQRLSRSGGPYSLAAFRSCKLHFLQQGFLAGERQVTLWGAGLEGKAWRTALIQSGFEVKQWIDVDPRKIGQIVHGAPVLDIDALDTGQGKVLITIGVKGARQQVRDYAQGKGLLEGEHFICVT